MEKISWTDHERNGEVLHTVEERNFLHTMKRRKAIWTGYMMHRNCLLKHVMEGKMGGTKVTGIQGIRLKQLLNDLKKIREYWKF